MSASSAKSSRILIAGCGYVGTALAIRLSEQGHSVFGLRRETSKLPTPIRQIAADLAQPNSLRHMPEDFHVVFYTAGSSAHTDESYHAAYVDGLRNLLDALSTQLSPPRRVIFTSSTAVYAQNDGSWVDEESPTAPDSFSGKRLLEAEALLAASRFETVTVRLGGIYGPHRTALVDRVRRGEARREKNSRYVNLIHRDDIVGTLIHLMNLPKPDHTYIGADDEPQEYNALLEWIAAKVGVASPPFADEPPTRARIVHNRRCSNARLRTSGYVMTYANARLGYARELESIDQ